jgi:hypothetical protein
MVILPVVREMIAVEQHKAFSCEAQAIDAPNAPAEAEALE